MNLPRMLATVALVASVAVPVTVAAPAAALSCVEVSEVLADADQVYAGRIIDARDSRILVDVTEVWKGGPVEEEVWLEVEVESWTSWAGKGGEIADGYASPEMWVFAPFDAGAVGPCSAWSLDDGMRKYLLSHRPDQPQDPVARTTRQHTGEATPAAEQTQSSAWPLVAGAGGVGVLVVAAVALVMAGWPASRTS